MSCKQPPYDVSQSSSPLARLVLRRSTSLYWCLGQVKLCLLISLLFLAHDGVGAREHSVLGHCHYHAIEGR